MPRKAPTRKSPRLTIYEPPTNEHPESTKRSQTVETLDEECARRIARDILIEKLGADTWTFDFVTTPVMLEVIAKTALGPKRYQYTWQPEQFDCLSDFLESVRPRLNELIPPQLLPDFGPMLEDIIQRVRASCVREESVEIPEEPSRPGDALDMATEVIRVSLGLEGRTERGQMARLRSLAAVDLRGVDRALRGTYRMARLVYQTLKAMK